MLDDTRARKKKKAVIAILIDALGWELVKKYKAFSDIADYRTGLRTILGFSSSAVPTVLSGVSGDKMELWNSVYYSPQTSPYKWLKRFEWVPELLKENRYSRFLIRQFSRRMAKHRGYFSDFAIPVKYLPQFDLCEKRNIYSPGGLIGNQSIFDDLERIQKKYKVYSYVQGASDEHIFSKVNNDIINSTSDVFYLYLCQLDAFLHAHVNEPEKVKQKIRWYERQVTNLVENAQKHYCNIVLHIFSDHGMVPIKSTVDMITTIKELGFTEGKDYAVMYDSTMARFWFMNAKCRDAITQKLFELEYGNIVSDTILKEEGAFFEDRRFGEIIFLMQPGTLICPSYMSYTPVQGMHGFSPDDPDMEASYLANIVPKAPPKHIRDIKRAILETI
nr:alkaline phosphatase family protein [uncultured Desulfobacter sp.]